MVGDDPTEQPGTLPRLVESGLTDYSTQDQ